MQALARLPCTPVSQVKHERDVFRADQALGESSPRGRNPRCAGSCHQVPASCGFHNNAAPPSPAGDAVREQDSNVLASLEAAQRHVLKVEGERDETLLALAK